MHRVTFLSRWNPTDQVSENVLSWCLRISASSLIGARNKPCIHGGQLRLSCCRKYANSWEDVGETICDGISFNWLRRGIGLRPVVDSCPGLHGVLLQFGAQKWTTDVVIKLEKWNKPTAGASTSHSSDLGWRLMMSRLYNGFCPQSSKLIVIKGEGNHGVIALMCSRNRFWCFFREKKQQEDLLITGGSTSKCDKEAKFKQSSQERSNLKRHTLRYFFKTTSFAAH